MILLPTLKDIPPESVDPELLKHLIPAPARHPLEETLYYGGREAPKESYAEQKRGFGGNTTPRKAR